MTEQELQQDETVSNPERWLPIAGFEGFYEISDAGNLLSLPKRGRVSRKLKPSLNGHGYYQATLCGADGKRRQALFHRLVLEAFVGPCPEGMECDHINADRTDNRAANLRWVTRQQNMDNRQRHGNQVRGERQRMAKLTEASVRAIVCLFTRRNMSLADIAARFDISKSLVSGIAANRLWRHVHVDGVSRPLPSRYKKGNRLLTSARAVE